VAAVLLIQILVNGLLLGCLYAAIAVGFSLVWGVMNIINVAHGTFVMIGAYITFSLFALWKVDPLASIPVSMVALFVVGYVLQRFLFNRLVRAPIFITFVLTYGVSLIIENAALVGFTAEYRSVRPWYADLGLELGGVKVSMTRVLVAAIALVLTSGLFVVMGRTRIGIAIRATRMNLEAAKLMGIRVARVYAITFGLGAALAGAAGSLMGTTYVITPGMGASYLFRAFTICIVGGLGNVYGALVGGIAFGLVETIGGFFIGTGAQEVLGMVMLVLVLVFKPNGIMGKRFYEI
jgi:branched-chain amino acid transport system permease protein